MASRKKRPTTAEADKRRDAKGLASLGLRKLKTPQKAANCPHNVYLIHESGRCFACEIEYQKRQRRIVKENKQ